MKKNIIFLLIFFCSIKSYSITLEGLIDKTVQNNSDIKNAYKNFEITLISKQTFDGLFSPSIITGFTEKLSSDESKTKNMSTYLLYSQQLPGNFVFSIEGNYEATFQNILNENYLFQIPSLKFNLSQSVLPFWLQGEKKDPRIENYKLQNEYSYYQYLNVKKNTLLNLIQNYIYAFIYKNEIQIHKNSIELSNEQINAINEMKDNGAINFSKVVELENLRWSYQQSLLSSEIDFTSCIKNIKTISGENFDANLLDFFIEANTTDIILNYLDNVSAPLEMLYQKTLEILKVNRVYEKQNSAPYLNISFTPTWSLNNTKTEQWLEPWESAETFSNWQMSFSIDFSPLFSSVSRKNSQRYSLNYEKTLDEFNSYIEQKKIILQEYLTLLNFYEQQKEELTRLIQKGIVELDDYKKIFEEGKISRIDYLSAEIRIKNQKLSRNMIDLYIYLYKFLIKMNEE